MACGKGVGDYAHTIPTALSPDSVEYFARKIIDLTVCAHAYRTDRFPTRAVAANVSSNWTFACGRHDTGDTC
jgi:hypothetical protein